MRALTIREPWASAIVFGAKRIENRSWQPPEPVLGRLIAIHAAKTYGLGEREHTYNLEIRDLLPANIPSVREPKEDPDTLGCVIGLARVVAVVPPYRQESTVTVVRYDGESQAIELAPWHASDSYGWVLEDVAPLTKPVPARGMLGFWTVPPDVEEAIQQARGTVQ